MTHKTPTKKNERVEAFLEKYHETNGYGIDQMRQDAISLILTIAIEALPEEMPKVPTNASSFKTVTGFNQCRKDFLTQLKANLGLEEATHI